MLRTHVAVFGSPTLWDHESAITCPRTGTELDGLKAESEVEFRCVADSTPGFRTEQQ